MNDDNFYGCVWMVALCLFLVVLSILSSIPSKEQLDAISAANRIARERDVAELQANKNMLAPRWWIKGYTHQGTTATYLSSLFYKPGEGGTITNEITTNMILFHLIAWSLLSLVVWLTRYPDDNEKAIFWWIGGYAIFGAFWAALWFLFGSIVPIFSPGSYIPFLFIGFILSAGLWTAVTTYGGVLLINFLSRRMLGEDANSGSRKAKSIRGVTKAEKVFRAIAKSLLIAVSSGIGTQLGEGIGGALVFVISASVCAFFEIHPPQLADK